MTDLLPAIVLFGDVVDSRLDPGTSDYLRGLRDELDAAYPAERLAPTGFTQGDEIQLLLAPGADPFRAVVRAALRAESRTLRWACAAGLVEPGTGPATERNGPAFHAARDLLERAKARREGLFAETGDPAADALLADLGPLLPERLGGSRATVSVIADRGRIRHVGRLASALATIFRDGVAGDAPATGEVPATGDTPDAGKVPAGGTPDRAGSLV